MMVLVPHKRIDAGSLKYEISLVKDSQYCGFCCNESDCTDKKGSWHFPNTDEIFEVSTDSHTKNTELSYIERNTATVVASSPKKRLEELDTTKSRLPSLSPFSASSSPISPQRIKLPPLPWQDYTVTVNKTVAPSNLSGQIDASHRIGDENANTLLESTLETSQDCFHAKARPSQNLSAGLSIEAPPEANISQNSQHGESSNEESFPV